MYEEENRKLLEWAGFEEYETPPRSGYKVYVAPNGERIVNLDFFDPELGLGLQFKYLVPKVCGVGDNPRNQIYSTIYWNGGLLFCQFCIEEIETKRRFCSSEVRSNAQVALGMVIVKWLESKGNEST